MFDALQTWLRRRLGRARAADLFDGPAVALANPVAVAAGDATRVAALVGQGADPNAQGHRGLMAESFVRTMKRDYIAFMPKPDAPTAMQHLALAFEHYNEHHPHSALNYRSPREFRRRRVSST